MFCARSACTQPVRCAPVTCHFVVLVRPDGFDEAVERGVGAAARPNAHAVILAIAAYSLALAGRLKEVTAHLGAIRGALPRDSVKDFLATMQFSPDGTAMVRTAARRLHGG
jgi:hypothetical protein